MRAASRRTTEVPAAEHGALRSSSRPAPSSAAASSSATPSSSKSASKSAQRGPWQSLVEHFRPRSSAGKAAKLEAQQRRKSAPRRHLEQDQHQPFDSNHGEPTVGSDIEIATDPTAAAARRKVSGRSSGRRPSLDAAKPGSRLSWSAGSNGANGMSTAFYPGSSSKSFNTDIDTARATMSVAEAAAQRRSLRLTSSSAAFSSNAQVPPTASAAGGVALRRMSAVPNSRRRHGDFETNDAHVGLSESEGEGGTYEEDHHIAQARALRRKSGRVVSAAREDHLGQNWQNPRISSSASKGTTVAKARRASLERHAEEAVRRKSKPKSLPRPPSVPSSPSESPTSSEGEDGHDTGFSHNLLIRTDDPADLARQTQRRPGARASSKPEAASRRQASKSSTNKRASIRTLTA
eukprot:CAMPEP_0171494696 /NCGR_PEP_ID=MMETSP0958-20121227/5702_1 /TAXON_ID=87120 /ORGANISM="Aurantiochytrium limacinum, Strain ATCCMYA-1381" /LENGTH=405 /DNA_ID=CAMNT_0012028541 /DNA_START=1055 /DNA_END=2269 /DNA_ORIENTATION=-